MSPKTPRAMVHEVARAIAYINDQDDFGPMTKATLIAMVKRVAEAAISDVEQVARQGEPRPEHRHGWGEICDSACPAWTEESPA